MRIACVLPLVLLLGPLGCGPSARTIVRSRAAHDLACPDADIRVAETGGGGLRAQGCGLEASYVCANTGYGPTCVREGGSAPAGAGRRSDESVQHLITLARPALGACIRESGAALRVRFTIDVTGRVVDAQPGDEASGSAGACLERALVGVTVEEAASAPRTVTVGLPAGWASDSSATDTTLGVEVAPEPAGDADAEAIIRSAVDARRDGIVACVGATTVALALAYDTAGVITVSLRGTLAGSDEERCVQAALAAVRLDPPPVTAGSLIHAVSAD